MLRANNELISVQIGIPEVEFESATKEYFIQNPDLTEDDYNKFIDVYKNQSEEGKMILRLISPTTFLKAIKNTPIGENEPEFDLQFMFGIEVEQSKAKRFVRAIQNFNDELKDVFEPPKDDPKDEVKSKEETSEES